MLPARPSASLLLSVRGWLSGLMGEIVLVVFGGSGVCRWFFGVLPVTVATILDIFV